MYYINGIPKCQVCFKKIKHNICMENKYGVRDLFAERLRNLIDERGLNIQKFSKETDIPVSTVSDWLNKKTTPTIENLPKIALFFKVTTDYLLGLEN